MVQMTGASDGAIRGILGTEKVEIPCCSATGKRRPIRFTCGCALETGMQAASVNLTTDIRNAIHALEIWPPRMSC